MLGFLGKISKVPIFFSLILMLVFPLSSNASTPVHLQVANCNSNGICEPALGENYPYCPLDCAASTSTTPTITPSRGGGSNDRIIRPIIIPSYNAVLITWSTGVPTKGTFTWGKTADYELGNIGEVNFNNEHSVKLNGLDSGTRYFFTIESSNENNIRYFGQGEFFTLPTADLTPPSNVTNIQVSYKDNKLIFTWVNPADKDFENVRVIRSTDFYSLDPLQGNVVFEGGDISFIDTTAIPGVDYYYTFFSKDTDDNYSSGALIHVKLTDSTLINIPLNSTLLHFQYNFLLTDMEVTQLDFDQNIEKQLSFFGDAINVESGLSIVIRIPKEKLLPDTSYVLLSIEDPKNPGTFNSYFIRTLHDQTSIEANIPASGTIGVASFFITFLDSDKEVISQTHGTFNVLVKGTNKDFSIFGLIYLWITQIMKGIKAFGGVIFWYLN